MYRQVLLFLETTQEYRTDLNRKEVRTMTSLNERIDKEMSELDRIRQLRRIRERNESIAQQKEDNYWIFLAGKIVAKHLKGFLNIPVYKGKDCTAKNAAAFEPLENICKYLSAHKEFTAQIARGGEDAQAVLD